jgi:hypothetical protein
MEDENARARRGGLITYVVRYLNGVRNELCDAYIRGEVTVRHTDVRCQIEGDDIWCASGPCEEPWLGAQAVLTLDGDVRDLARVLVDRALAVETASDHAHDPEV